MQLIGCARVRACVHTHPFYDAQRCCSKGAKEATKISWDVKPNVQIWSEMGKRIISIVETFILAPCKNNHLLLPHKRH